MAQPLSKMESPLRDAERLVRSVYTIHIATMANDTLGHSPDELELMLEVLLSRASDLIGEAVEAFEVASKEASHEG